MVKQSQTVISWGTHIKLIDTAAIVPLGIQESYLFFSKTITYSIEETENELNKISKGSIMAIVLYVYNIQRWL